DRAAVSGVGQAVDVNLEALAGTHRRVVADEVAADDRAGEARGVPGRRVGRPGDAVGKVVGHVDVGGDAIAVVRDRDVEADLVAGADRTNGVGVLDDRDVRAEDVNRAAVGVVAELVRRLIRRGDGRRGRDHIAVRADTPRRARSQP